MGFTWHNSHKRSLARSKGHFSLLLPSVFPSPAFKLRSHHIPSHFLSWKKGKKLEAEIGGMKERMKMEKREESERQGGWGQGQGGPQPQCIVLGSIHLNK